jgi:hypothetical protein
MSADNQQERLIQVGWVTGFVDGEGCFSIGLIKQPIGCKTGYQVFHEFVVTQGAKSLDCLHEVREFFGVGQVLVNKRHDNHREHLYRYVVRKRSDLLNTVIPFFEQYPLRSAKREDFQKFTLCVRMVDANLHLSHKGLIEIVEIVQTMNRRKSKEDLIRILRDYTPSLASGNCE